MIDKLKDDAIKNEELFDCLNSKNFNIVGLSIYKIIDRKFCDKNIIKALTKIAGPYQLGHLAIAALFLVGDKSALEYFNQLSENLNDNDKYLVDNLIKGMQANGEKGV